MFLPPNVFPIDHVVVCVLRAERSAQHQCGGRRGPRLGPTRPVTANWPTCRENTGRTREEHDSSRLEELLVKQGEQPSYGIECVNPWAPSCIPPTSERGTTFTSHRCRSGIPPAACKDNRAGGMPAAAGAEITSGDASGSSSPRSPAFETLSSTSILVFRHLHAFDVRWGNADPTSVESTRGRKR